jgi:hypothetical protein
MAGSVNQTRHEETAVRSATMTIAVSGGIRTFIIQALL